MIHTINVYLPEGTYVHLTDTLDDKSPLPKIAQFFHDSFKDQRSAHQVFLMQGSMPTPEGMIVTPEKLEVFPDLKANPKWTHKEANRVKCEWKVGDKTYDALNFASKLAQIRLKRRINFKCLDDFASMLFTESAVMSMKADLDAEYDKEAQDIYAEPKQKPKNKSKS